MSLAAYQKRGGICTGRADGLVWSLSSGLIGSVAAESGDRCRSFGPGNRSLHDAVEPWKISALFVYGVIAALPVEIIAMLFQMPDEFDAFHATGSISISRMTSEPFSDCSESSPFALRTIVTASSRFARASSSVSPCVFA